MEAAKRNAPQAGTGEANSDTNQTVAVDDTADAVRKQVPNPREQVATFEPPEGFAQYGCKAAGWDVMARLLGGVERLLPVACDPHAWNARGYRRDGQRQLAGGSFGKTPSVIGTNGVHGIPGWRDINATPELVAQWSANPDHGILVRLGDGSGIVALDIDIEREDVVASMMQICASNFGHERWAHTPIRHRCNSARRTILFRVNDPEWRSIPTKSPIVDPVYRDDAGKGAFELLADGRQTLWAGTHPSGARLVHDNLIPELGLPVLTADEAIDLWTTLVDTFADAPADVPGFFEGKATGGVSGTTTDDPIGEWLLAQGLVHGEDEGKLHVDCPWQHKHTGGETAVGSASWLPAMLQADGTITPGRFKCLHTSCKPQSDDRWEFLRAVGCPETLYRKPSEALKADTSSFTALARPENVAASGGLAPAAGSARYKLKTFADLKASAKPLWLVSNVLPTSGLAAIYGPSGSGKSFLAMQMGLSIAGASDEWFGHKVREHRPVIYMGLEGAAGVKLRLEAYAMHNDCLVPDSFRVVSEQQFNLASPTDTADLIESIRSEFPDGAVVFIDTLNRASEGVDENSGKEMTLIYARAMQIQESLRGLVVIVTHTGKDEAKGVRGHSSQFAALDAAIAVSRNGEAREWKLAKAKDGEDGLTGYFTLTSRTLGYDDEGAPISSAVVSIMQQQKNSVRHKPNEDKALGALMSAMEANPNGVTIELWKHAFCNTHCNGNMKSKREAFNTASKALVDGRFVTQDGGFFRLATGGWAPN